MSIMKSLEDLPADVVVEIFLFLSDLTTLYNTICSSKRLYETFSNRRAVILTHVYSNQLSTSLPILFGTEVSLHLFPRSWQRLRAAVKRVQDFCLKPSLDTCDSLVLTRGAWKCLIEYQRPPLNTIISFGRRSMELYDKLGHPAFALQTVKEVETTIEQNGLVFCTDRSYVEDVKQFKLSAAMIYCRAGKPYTAIQLLYNYLGIRGFSTDTTPLLLLLELMKKNPTPEFENNLLDLMSAELARLRATPGNSHASQILEGLHHLVCLQLGRSEEASQIFERALRHVTSSPPHFARIIAMARRLIRSSKEAGNNQHILDVRRLVLEKMHTLGLAQRNTVMYLAWARGYAADAQAFGQPHLAIHIHEQVLQWLRAQPDSPENAKRKLVAVYTVQMAYKQIGVQPDLHIRGADSTATREDTLNRRYLKANMSIPIMT